MKLYITETFTGNEIEMKYITIDVKKYKYNVNNLVNFILELCNNKNFDPKESYKTTISFTEFDSKKTIINFDNLLNLMYYVSNSIYLRSVTLSSPYIDEQIFSYMKNIERNENIEHCMAWLDAESLEKARNNAMIEDIIK